MRHDRGNSGNRDRRLRILTFTTLYPNAAHPRLGLFVEQRLLHLLARQRVQTTVVAPIPWFPFTSRVFGRYGAFARVPTSESRHGVHIRHPRFPLLPKIGQTLAPILMARAVKPELERIRRAGFDFQLIDAHYFYPDGVAASLLGRWLRRPVTITARGTDINLIPRHPLARRQILWAARSCSAMIAVCQALKDRMVELGMAETQITVLRNGVDLELFRPVDRAEARRHLDFRGPTLLSVGYLIERKGHHIAIRALPDIPDAQLVIVGEGAMRTALENLARELGVQERVRFVGALSHSVLREYYSAADALVLASDREGMANVLLEALACGTPVIASAVWGTPEVVASPEAGVLMALRTPEALVKAYHDLMACYPNRSRTREYAETFSWVPTVRGLVAIFSRVAFPES
jgi:glycosyltransferase involved in cell wall biosynthesis